MKKIFEEKSPWELLSELETDFGNFVKIVNSLHKRKLIEVKDGKVRISKLGKKLVKKEKEVFI